MRTRSVGAWLTGLLLATSCAGQPAAPSASTSPASSRPSSDASAAAPVAPPAAPKRFTVAISGDPNTLSNSVARAGAGGVPGLDTLEAMVSAGLTTESDQGVRQPQLSEGSPTIENGRWKLLPDGRMETTWHLKSTAKWHDGAPVTAQDLVFTLQIGQDKEIPALTNVGFNSIESVDAPDERTILVRWQRPFILADALFSYDFAVPLPKHLLERSYLEDKPNFTQVPYWTAEFIGSGPYRVRDWVQGSHIILAAFEDYALGRPKIDEIEVRFIRDPNALIASVLAGEVGMTMGRGLSLEQAVQLRDQWRDGKLGSVLSSWIAAYPQMLNPNPAIVADARFRRALMHGVDRQSLVDTLQAGESMVADSYLSPRDPSYRAIESKVVRYEYDQRRATEIIESLGYTRGPEGGFRDSAGQRLTIEARTTGGDDLQEKTLFTMSDYWQRLGITMEPVVVPRQRAQDREYRANFPAFEQVRQPNNVTPGALTRYYSAESSLPENNYRGSNRMRYRNSDLDALIDRFYATVPPTERNQVLGDIMGHMSDQVIPLGMFYNVAPTMISNRLVNVGPGGGGVSPTWNVHEWDVRS